MQYNLDKITKKSTENNTQLSIVGRIMTPYSINKTKRKMLNTETKQN